MTRSKGTNLFYGETEHSATISQNPAISRQPFGKCEDQMEGAMFVSVCKPCSDWVAVEESEC